MEFIMDRIIEIVAFLVLVALLILAVKARSYLGKLMTKEEADAFDKFVDDIVGAADQMFKEVDPDGTIRLDYVYEMLVKAGHDVTDAVRAKIENKVLKLDGGEVK